MSDYATTHDKDLQPLIQALEATFGPGIKRIEIVLAVDSVVTAKVERLCPKGLVTNTEVFKLFSAERWERQSDDNDGP